MPCGDSTGILVPSRCRSALRCANSDHGLFACSHGQFRLEERNESNCLRFRCSIYVGSSGQRRRLRQRIFSFQRHIRCAALQNLAQLHGAGQLLLSWEYQPLHGFHRLELLPVGSILGVLRRQFREFVFQFLRLPVWPVVPRQSEFLALSGQRPLRVFRFSPRQ